jgi:hypothetical protein
MAQTAAQKAAAQKAEAQKALAKAQAALTKSTAQLSKLQGTGSVTASDYAMRNAGFNADGTLRTPEQTSAAIAPIVAASQAKTAAGQAAAVQAAENDYYTVKVGSTGKTQSQLDAAENAKKVAKEIGGTVDAKTGYVVKPGVSSSVDLNGDGFPDAASQGLTTGRTTQQVDAIAAISALLSSYGIGDLSGAITNAVQKGYSSDTIQLIMQDPNSSDPLAVAFQTRFPANKARLKAGKPVLSAGEYLAAERSYAQVMQSYGVGNMASRERMNAFITNDISAAEVSDRVGLAVSRVQNADPATKKMLAEYYPMLNQSDIIGAVLDPAEGLPALQRKVQIAEIGGAALAQGLTTGMKAVNNLQTGFSNVTGAAMGAEELANLGVTKEQARQGFQQVAEVAPRGEFLSSISGGEDYGRLQAEQEAFQGLASAKRARVSLTQQEQARFSGSSGTSKASLTSQRSGSF